MSKKLAFCTNLIYFLVVVGFVCIRIFSNLGWFSFLGDSARYVLSFVTQIVLMLVFPLVMFRLLTKMKAKDMAKFCSVRKVSGKTIFVAIFLGVVVFLINIYVSSFFNTFIGFFGYKSVGGPSTSLEPSWWTLLLDLLCTAIFPGVCEEMLHRGLLLKGNSNLGMTKSIVISGVLFGLLHLNIEQFFYATIIGFFLGYLCWSCNSIIPCMIVHFMNNAISVFLSFAAKKGWAIANVIAGFENFLFQSKFLGVLLSILILALLTLVAVELVKILIKDNFQYNFERRKKELQNMAIREAYFKQIDDIKNNREIPSTEVVFVEFREFLNFISKNIEKEQPQQQKEIENVELKCKILLFSSIVLCAIVTFMTFVWGFFR